MTHSSYQYSIINRQFTKLVFLFKDLFFHPIVMNATFHCSWGRIVHRNWGDDINYFFLKELFNRHITPLFFSSVAMRKHLPNYLCIGSSITLQCTSDTIIWGGGVIDPSANLPAIPKKVLAVRGPLTRKYLLEHNIQCPEVYGDPALLISLYYKPQIKKKYKLGIIPHYDDFYNPILDKLKKNPDILWIKMEGYKDWKDVLDQINSCETIASSSLHGLIMAEAYGIPNLWIEIGGKLLGGHFKFHDFFLSLGEDRLCPFSINVNTHLNDILISAMEPHQINCLQSSLIGTCPFSISDGFKIE